MNKNIATGLLLLVVIAGWVGSGSAQDSTSIDLTDFSLEELLDMEVVSISRRAESVRGAAAAVFVISAEDIRRSGVHSIPEVLRLAPGLNVARISAGMWAITSRGFNSRFANTLQVLVDGRSIYSPMFSGVYWENSAVMLEDIERIEIIRGPGATMWGANAVNGIINIITARPDPVEPKSFLTALVGTEIEYRGAGRVDGKLGKSGAWRLSGKVLSHGASRMETGAESHDAWDEHQFRVRWDQEMGPQDILTVTGHYFHGDLENNFVHNTPTPPYSVIEEGQVDFRTGSIQTIWAREYSRTAGLKLGLYFTHFDRQEHLLAEIHNIVDADFQHSFAAGRGHALIWGGTWRYYHDNIRGHDSIFFTPASSDGRVFSAFVQNDWTVVPERFHIILGSKWEYRSDVENQWQPNLRTAWTPAENITWWASVARAVRVPSRANRHINLDMTILPPNSMFPGSPATSITMLGNPDMIPEELVAYETGFRYKPTANLALDLALFINEYEDIRILEPGSMVPHPVYGPPMMMMPMVMGNGPGGQTRGGELAVNWAVAKPYRFQLAYSYWDFKPADVANGEPTGMERMSTPKHQMSMRGVFNPRPHWEADVWLRISDRLLAAPDGVQDWSELDLRLSWLTATRLRLTLGGRNLLHESHQEFIDKSAAANVAWIQRSGYLEFRWDF